MLDQLPTVRESRPLSLAAWLEQRILPLRDLGPEEQQARVSTWWRALDRLERFILLKLLTGEFRVGVSQTLVVRALAVAAGLEPPIVAARLMGEWTPTAEWFDNVLSKEHTDEDRSPPYPFCLAAPLDGNVAALGSPATGRSSGSGTASARSSFAALTRSTSGRAGRN